MDERDYKAMNAEIKNQTAVEWLEEIIYGDKEFSLSEAFAKAKEMEKNQIIKAHGNKQKTKSNANSIVTYAYTYTGEMYFNDNYY